MLTGKTVSVGTTAVDLLSGIDVDKTYELVIRYVPAGGAEVSLGSSSVTASNGFRLPATEGIYRFTIDGERMYAVTQSGTINLHVLAYRV